MKTGLLRNFALGLECMELVVKKFGFKKKFLRGNLLYPLNETSCFWFMFSLTLKIFVGFEINDKTRADYRKPGNLEMETKPLQRASQRKNINNTLYEFTLFCRIYLVLLEVAFRVHCHFHHLYYAG